MDLPLIGKPMEGINPHKCIARMWNKGCGGQCSYSKKFGEYCKRHISEENRWCGILTEPRPRNPISPNGKINKWKCHKVKEESDKEPAKGPVKEPTKKKELVKKKIPLYKQDPIIEDDIDGDTSDEEVSEELLVSGDDVVLQGDILTYQGKEYYIVDETFKILDDGLEEIGEWDPVKKVIMFL